MQTVGYKTLFQRLGVSPDADDEAISQAGAEWLARCHGDYNAIPRDIDHAIRFLSVADNRRHYRDLLDACENGHGIEFAPASHESLAILCKMTEIRPIADPHRANTFHFRRPDQPDPEWLQPRIERPGVIRDESSALWRFLTFQVFRHASPRQKAGYAALYAAIVIGLYGGVEWISRGRDESTIARIVVGPSPAAVEQARQKALEQSIRSKLANAQAELKSLDTAIAGIGRSFKGVVGLDWQGADQPGIQKSRELDLALIRHDSVREAWTSLLASRIPTDELTSRRSTVEAIDRQAENGKFRVEDEQTLQQIIDWGQGRGRQLQSQPRNIEHIRVMLAAETFEMAGDEERRAP